MCMHIIMTYVCYCTAQAATDSPPLLSGYFIYRICAVTPSGSTATCFHTSSASVCKSYRKKMETRLSPAVALYAVNVNLKLHTLGW